MNLILLDPRELDAQRRAHLSDQRAAHLLKVLQVAPGDEVRVGVIDGPRGSAAVEHVDANAVTLRCEMDADTPPRPAVDLLLALPRPKVMRRLWAQIAALGAGHIMLTNAERVERNYFDAHTLSPEGYTPLLIEGLQQARDTRVPAVTIHKQFRVLVEDELDRLFPDGTRLVADPSATASIREAVQRQSGRVLLAVGPEGGWNRFEVDLLKAHRFVPVGIGPRTLRTDTACVALLALTQDALRERPAQAPAPSTISN